MAQAHDTEHEDDPARDEDGLHDSAQVDLVVLAATGDVPDGVVENRLEKTQRRDRRDERDDEQHSEYPSVLLVVSHTEAPPRSRPPRSRAKLQPEYHVFHQPHV